MLRRWQGHRPGLFDTVRTGSGASRPTAANPSRPFRFVDNVIRSAGRRAVLPPGSRTGQLAAPYEASRPLSGPRPGSSPQRIIRRRARLAHLELDLVELTAHRSINRLHGLGPVSCTGLLLKASGGTAAPAEQQNEWCDHLVIAPFPAWSLTSEIGLARDDCVMNVRTSAAHSCMRRGDDAARRPKRCGAPGSDYKCIDPKTQLPVEIGSLT